MNLSTLIGQYRDRIEGSWEERLSPDFASEWKEKAVTGKETSSGCLVQQTVAKKGIAPRGRLLRGISNLALSIWDTSWCQSEIQFFNDHCRKNLLSRW
jgi:hypothetical protein